MKGRTKNVVPAHQQRLGGSQGHHSEDVRRERERMADMMEGIEKTVHVVVMAGTQPKTNSLFMREKKGGHK